MERFVEVTSHSHSGKLYVDQIPRSTKLRVLAEGSFWWFVDPQVKGVVGEPEYILVPKRCAKLLTQAA